MYGVGIQVAFDSPEGVLIGFGSEPSDLSTAGMRRAFDKARQGAVRDPEFRSLPRPGGAARELFDYHDPALLAISDAQLVESGWKVLQGGLRVFLSSGSLADLAGSVADVRGLCWIRCGDAALRPESQPLAPR